MATKKPDLIAQRLAEWRTVLDVRRAERIIPSTPMLSEAAKYFDLDPTKAADATILLHILADVIFKPARAPNRPGGSRKWDVQRLFRLGVHRMLVEREAPHISDRKAGAAIKQRFPKCYQHDDDRTIRQRLPAARLEVTRWLEAGGLEAHRLCSARNRAPGRSEPETYWQSITKARTLLAAFRREGWDESETTEALEMATYFLKIEQVLDEEKSAQVLWPDRSA
jgi:hypothetical protein